MHIIVKNNRFRCRIHDMESFLDMTLKNTHKLWKLMFTEAWNNEDSIEAVKQWLVDTEAEFGSSLTYRECAMLEAFREAEEKRRIKEAHGSVATKETKQAVREARRNAKQAESLYKWTNRHYVKVEKLKAIFLGLHLRYWW